MIKRSPWGTQLIRMVYVFFVGAAIALFFCSPWIVRMLRHQKSINVLTWPTELDSEFIGDFEKNTGIKVNLSYVETNEEILAKIRLSGANGYDLIIASDYMIEQMVQSKLLKPIEKSQLIWWDALYPHLTDRYFDPHNLFSIPFVWDIYGICIDTNFIDVATAPAVGWALIFDRSKIDGAIGMIEDYREAVILVATYLWQNTNTLETLQDLSVIKHLLREQRNWVARYTDARAGMLVASKASRCAVTISTDVIRLQQYHPHLAFVIPDQGKFMIIDSFAIPQHTAKQEYVYQFLNYLYDPQILQLYANKHTLRTAHTRVQSQVITDTLIPDGQLMSQFSFFRTGVSENQLMQLWVSVLS